LDTDPDPHGISLIWFSVTYPVTLLIINGRIPVGKEMSVGEMYEEIKKKAHKLTLSEFLDQFQEFYEALRKADVLLLMKNKMAPIKYPWEEILK
jgi:hypothetical protein